MNAAVSQEQPLPILVSIGDKHQEELWGLPEGLGLRIVSVPLFAGLRYRDLVSVRRVNGALIYVATLEASGCATFHISFLVTSARERVLSAFQDAIRGEMLSESNGHLLGVAVLSRDVPSRVFTMLERFEQQGYLYYTVTQ